MKCISKYLVVCLILLSSLVASGYRVIESRFETVEAEDFTYKEGDLRQLSVSQVLTDKEVFCSEYTLYLLVNPLELQGYDVVLKNGEDFIDLLAKSKDSKIRIVYNKSKMLATLYSTDESVAAFVREEMK